MQFEFVTFHVVLFFCATVVDCNREISTIAETECGVCPEKYWDGMVCADSSKYNMFTLFFSKATHSNILQ